MAIKYRWTRSQMLAVAVNATMAGIGATALLGELSVGQVALLLLVSGVVIVWTVIATIGRISMGSLFLASYVALYYLQPMTVAVLGPRDLYASYATELPLYVFLTIGGIHLLVMAYVLAQGGSTSHQSTLTVDARSLRRALLVLGLVNVGALLALLLDAGTLSGALALTRVERKATAGAVTLAGAYLLYCGLAFFALLPAFLRRVRPVAPAILVATLSFSVMVFLVVRTRSVVLGQLVALAAGFSVIAPRVRFSGLHPRPAPSRSSMRWRHALLVGAVVIVAFVGIYARFARGGFEQAGVAGLLHVSLEDAIRLSVLGGDLGYTFTVLEVMRAVPEEHPFLNGQSYYRLLFVPVPRTLWPQKPENSQRVVAKLLYPDVPHLTIPPGFQGDTYLNFGAGGVFVFPVVGLVLGWIDRKRSLAGLLFAGTCFAPVFHLARGGFTNPVLLLVVIGAVAHLFGNVAAGRGIRFRLGRRLLGAGSAPFPVASRGRH